MGENQYPEELVFGLDIGTRSIVGTVGYRDIKGRFQVVALSVKEHETRAMLDGQIHDIEAVAKSIVEIKGKLEQVIGRKLEEVCIAAAGRVLKTVTVDAEMEFDSTQEITQENIHSLELIGVEHAYDDFRKEVGKTDLNFYCVGYTVVNYTLNDYVMLNLEGHKGTKIGCKLLATFLPEEVVDGLYSAVKRADLNVANLTLEPIAAIQVAIPEKFRLLNLALVDVGAGTSDICITRDGSITAYGMIPFAGDELTETIVKEYLVDFDTAEKIKLSSMQTEGSIKYQDIIGLEHEITPEELSKVIEPVIDHITSNVSDKIMELNGDKPVSAVFVVGGGGKVRSFTDHIATHLNIQKERVALRGEEVLGEVDFYQKDVKKDSLLVTPIGICLNYYEQKNNFIFVNVNGQRVKLYDNSRLTIMDAAIQIGIKNDDLFPKRGTSIEFTVNGEKRMIRGLLGEAAVVRCNGKDAGITNAIEQNDQIEIVLSTRGEGVSYEIEQLPEYHANISFTFNGKQIICPKFASVNGQLVPGHYEVKQDDDIIILDYYTLGQVLEFMDLPYNSDIMVNHVIASRDEKVYEKFEIDYEQKMEPVLEPEKPEVIEQMEPVQKVVEEKAKVEVTRGEDNTAWHIIVNDRPITLTGKQSYIFVDILDVYEFDMQQGLGKQLVMTVDEAPAEFITALHDGCVVKMYWRD